MNELAITINTISGLAAAFMLYAVYAETKVAQQKPVSLAQIEVRNRQPVARNSRRQNARYHHVA